MTPFSLLLLAFASLFHILLVAAEPKVVGFDFTKEARRVSRDSLERRQQKNVQATIANYELLYLINVTIGTPPQPFALQLDTGSSDIWIASSSSNACRYNRQGCQAVGAFRNTSSSTFELLAANAFQIQYVDGSQIAGDYFSDMLNIGRTSIKNMTMGLASTADRPLGIMGIGYQAGESIAAEAPNQIYPNVINQLVNQGYINTLAYSLWLNDLDANSGSILFGGVDTAKYQGDLIAVPVQPDSQSGSLTSFTVALTSINIADGSGNSQYSQTSLNTPVILDSGTTLTYLPDNIANAIIQGVGATNNREYGVVVPCSLGRSDATFSFGFGGAGGPVINVPLNELVLPLTDNQGNTVTFRNGNEACTFGINPAGNAPNLFGDTFLRSAYVVYDLQNNQLGLANTNFNATGSKIVEISGNTIPGATATASGVQVTQTFSGYPLQTQSRVSASAQASFNTANPTFHFVSSATTATASASLTTTARSASSMKIPPVGTTALGVVGLVTFLSFVLGGPLLLLL